MGAGTNGSGGVGVDQRRRRPGAAAPGAESPRGDVFDQLGNSGVLAHAGAQETEAEPPSALALAESDGSTLSRSDLERAAAEEEAARRAVGAIDAGESTEEAAGLTGQNEVVPIELIDPTELGTSDQAKRVALGGEGEAAVARALDHAAQALGTVEVDPAARELVSERVRDNLEVDDIVRARREGRIDELVQQAIRAEAIRSRDEVDFLLQQLAQDEHKLGEILAGGTPDAIAVALIEHLAIELVEIEDLYALAAYDHGDILKKVVLGDEARNVHRRLSPLAMRMGGFSAVAYQMVVDELRRHPIPVDPTADGAPAPLLQDDPRLPAFRRNLAALIADLRLFRTASAA